MRPALTRATYCRLLWVWFALLAAVLGSGELITRWCKHWVGVHVDAPVRRAIVAAHGPQHTAAATVTVLGDQRLAIVLLLVVCAALWRWRPGVVLAAPIAFFGADAITTLAKLIVRRPGPPGRVGIGLLDYAFPSGHTTAATSLLLGAALLLPIARPVQRYTLVAVAGAVSVSVGWSRVVLDAHWVTDVIAGLVLGTVWTGVVAATFTRASAGDGPPAGSEHLAQMNG